MEITLKVNKEAVYDEVAKTTEYTGAKMTDEQAYDLIATTEEDQAMLERFWNECKNMICNSLKKILVSEIEEDAEYKMTLGLSAAFDESLTESMQRSLFSFFVINITSKWYTFTNKKEVTAYATEAASCVDDIMRKAFFKKRPQRPTYE